MAFDWRQFHAFAEELAPRPDEAARRTAISRAYYAVYGLTARYLIEKRVLAPGAINHRSVWQAFAQPSDRERWSIREWGFVLKDSREMADYRQQTPVERRH
jgi:hypothetical protein